MRKKKRQGLAGGFVALPNEMIKTYAYKKLAGYSVKALILCLLKAKVRDEHQRYSITFEMTYPEARAYGILDHAFQRAVNQLVELGFIVIVRRGGLSGGIKTTNLYRLSANYKEYETDKFQTVRKGYAEGIHG